MIQNAIHIHAQNDGIHVMELIDGVYFEAFLPFSWYELIAALSAMQWLDRSDVHIFVR